MDKTTEKAEKIDKTTEKSEKNEKAEKNEENTKTDSKTDSKTDVDVWTDQQQLALETALKTYPSTLSANERWTKISSEVQGKTKKQCVDRYKYLSTLLKNSK